MTHRRASKRFTVVSLLGVAHSPWGGAHGRKRDTTARGRCALRVTSTGLSLAFLLR